jgi:hypothetical protein
MEQTANQRHVPPALMAAIVAGLVLVVVSPLLAVPLAPVLIIAGAVTLRRSPDPVVRGLAWGALIGGIVLLALIALFLLGLMAFSAGAVVTESQLEIAETPWPSPSAGP